MGQKCSFRPLVFLKFSEVLAPPPPFKNPAYATAPNKLICYLWYNLLFPKKYSKSKFNCYVQVVHNGTGAYASFNFSFENTKRALFRSHNLRFTVTPDERSGDDIIFGYRAVAGNVKNYAQFLDS